MAWPYNRMWLPASYGRDRRVEYEALLERVTLWDVGCERALELTGPDAVAFADYLLTRDIAGQTVGRCRHATACDENGVIICEALVLRLSDERVWICHGPADFPLWARAVALHTEHEVEVHEAPVSPLALQGPRALDVMKALAPSVASMPRYAWDWTSIAGVEVLVSRTGWSGEFGYEVFAPDVEPARRVWQEVRRASDPFGVLVTPVIGERAWERGVTDIRYGDNLEINPFEVGLEYTVDLDKDAPIHRAGRASSDRGRHDPEASRGRVHDRWRGPARTRDVLAGQDARRRRADRRRVASRVLVRAGTARRRRAARRAGGDRYPARAAVAVGSADGHGRVAPARPRGGNRTLTRLTAAGHTGGLI